MFKDIIKNNVYPNFIDGKWVTTEQTIDVISPIDGKLVGKTSAMSQDDVDRATASNLEAYKTWRNTDLMERGEIIIKAADILEENAEMISDIMVTEIAKGKKDALKEIVRTAFIMRQTVEYGKQLYNKILRGDETTPGAKNTICVTRRDPLGIVLSIAPFNYPVNLSGSKLAPALMTGNVVLFKPPSQGAISALHLVRAFELAGVPKGVINTAMGRGSVIGDYLGSHKDVRMINLTASSDVGHTVAKASGMVSMIMELGGKDPAIVLEDADMDLTVSQIVGGAFSYSGQRCTAVKRVFVLDHMADDLAKRLKAKVETLTVGSPWDNCTVTHVINEKSADFIMSLVEDAKAKGATILTGDKREGNLIQPTLIDHVTTDMKIAWEEPFGPVLPIIRVKSIEEAIELSNQSEFGLQASVFTRDINKAMTIADRLEAGSVQINNAPSRGPDHFPFSGVKNSGIGVQGIQYSLEAMTQVKATILNIKSSDL